MSGEQETPEGAGAPEGAEAPEAAPAPPVGWLPRSAEEIFGAGASADESYEVLTVDVPPGSWTDALRTARDELGCDYFDWLSAVDEPGTGFRVSAHVVALGAPPRRLLIRTTVSHEAPELPTATPVFAGAAWHERETHEMFGIAFTGHPHLVPLLLPDGFEGYPLRKDFVLAARVVKAWPGAKEPGEPAAGTGHGGPKRRQMLPPGVPDPNEWGPLKGQLPPAPARPARTARTAADGPRRARSATAGSASQREGAPVRRTRTAAGGSASQTGGAEGPEPQTGESAAAPERRRPAPRGSDAPWHQPDAAPEPATPAEPEPGAAPEPPAEHTTDDTEGGDAR
ncbi:NADH-quinone oxidoreductase subunit C [Streptomyces sp. NPDC051940]|uniref:NADH-quinone oxidoreductase subunit C n=1 Tax=Streptomyces sp. NPDC051940 TaxID=3155675 RepID=UPI0034419E47